MLKRLMLLSLLFIFAIITIACSGGGDSSSTSPPTPAIQVSMSSIEYPTFGYPMKALVRPNGDVLVSVSSNAKIDGVMSNAISGIQIFTKDLKNPLNTLLVNPCANQTPQIFQARPANADTQFFGMSAYPGFENSLGIAVEENGADFYTIQDIRTCNTINPVTHVAQPKNNPAIYPKIPTTSSAFDLLFTKDGEYAFVANEYADSIPQQGFVGAVGILKVSRSNTGDFGGTAVIPSNPYIGVPNSGAIPGISLSQDGTRLYVTSEVAYPAMSGGTSNQDPTDSKNPTLTGQRCYGPYKPNEAPQWNGLLTIIDVQKAIAGLGQAAIIKSIAAGCSPVRAVETSNGKTLWLTARGDNAVLAFDVPSLLSSSPNNSLVGYTYSGGSAPVGLALFNNDQLLAVANSNRFTPKNAPNDPNITNVAILDIRNPAKASVVNTTPTCGLNAFPRNITVGADGTTLYVVNFNVGVLQVISTTIQK